MSVPVSAIVLVVSKKLWIFLLLIVFIGLIVGAFQFFQWWGYFLPKVDVRVLAKNVESFGYNPNTNNVIYSEFGPKKSFFIYSLNSGDKTKVLDTTNFVLTGDFTDGSREAFFTTLDNEFVIVGSEYVNGHAQDTSYLIHKNFSAEKISTETKNSLLQLKMKNPNLDYHSDNLSGLGGRRIYEDKKEDFKIMIEPGWSFPTIKVFFKHKYLEWAEDFQANSSGYYLTKNNELLLQKDNSLVLLK